MSTPQSRAVAWDLVEHVRATLTVGELHAVFVQLGLGEDRAAIGIMLQSLMRAAGPRLPEQLRARLEQVGYVDEEFVTLYQAASRVGNHHRS